MTEIYNDNVQVTLTIDGDEWHVIDAKVELSRMKTPNYVDLIMLPDPQDTTIPADVSQLIGAPFRLEVDNDLISERDTDAEEDTLLFDGQLANISPTGEKTYEGIAYDPAQQPFAEEGDGGSIMNQFIDIGLPEYSYKSYMFEGANQGGTVLEPQFIKASELVERVMEELGITDYEIRLSEEGETISGPEEEYTAGEDKTLSFDQSLIKVEDALDRVRETTRTEWWFDKEGTFNLGIPNPTKHSLQFITESSAGKTTPPYQSVRVIGSGAASQEGYSRTSMNIEDKIVVERNLALEEGSRDPVSVEVPEGEDPKNPVFTYRNLEISSIQQAKDTAEKLAEDLGEQQADGTITVTGFPEVVPFDGILMPQSVNSEGENYNKNQPMGGRAYKVYKVTHRLNSSDGFITKIQVGGLSGVTKTVVSSQVLNNESEPINSSADLAQRIS